MKVPKPGCQSCAVLGVLAVLLAPRPAAAQRASATLDFQASDPSCPDEQAFRDIVAGRLGHDPFVRDAAWTIKARIETRGTRLLGSVEVHDSSGSVLGARQIAGARSECGEIASALAITISVALDPQGKAATATATKAEPAPAAPPFAPVPAPVPELPPIPREPPPRAAPARPWAFTADAGVAADFGLAPASLLGPTLSVGARRSLFSILTEGRAGLSMGTARSSTGDRLDATLFTAGPTGCVHFEPGLACLGLELGAFQGRAIDVEDSRTQTSFFSAATARVGIGYALSRALELRFLGQLSVPLVRTSLTIDDAAVWNAPPLGAGLRAALAATFL